MMPDSPDFGAGEKICEARRKISGAPHYWVPPAWHFIIRKIFRNFATQEI